MPGRSLAASALARIPWTAEVVQRLPGGGEPPATGYRLDRLADALPAWAEAARRSHPGADAARPRRILVFAYLAWWIEHATLLSLLLAAVGHEVTLVTSPFRRWTVDPSGFDLRRQRGYLRRVLQTVAPVLRVGDVIHHGRSSLPSGLLRLLDRQSDLDVQYTLQREAVEWDADPEAIALRRLRVSRNQAAAAGALAWLDRTSADSVVVPNGSILEFGAVFHAARSRGVPVATYEFGEQRDRMWLARNAQVMRQDTRDLWKARGSIPLTDDERDALRGMYAARRVGASWANFARRWQSGESEGVAAARARLGLDPARRVVLVCTNVVGDSLALDRQIFSTGMSEWLARTVQHLSFRPEVQTIVRVHPGEMLGAGHPSQDIVRETLPTLPENIRLIAPDSPVNTYDLIGLADIGLVYTTTVGMEMAMAGVPVLVAGDTHYRGKGFTFDPESWEAYFATLDGRLDAPAGSRLTESQVELAERYAYRFFFEYPVPYPWHLIGFWDDVQRRPPVDIFPNAASEYRRTLAALVGEPVGWEESR